MITLVREGNIPNTPLKEFIGKSTDTKPAEVIPNGSMYLEMDTKKLYVFDAETKTWGEF